MRRIFLLSLFAACWLQTADAQVDVGYPNTAIGASPYFGMDAPDQNRSRFHLALGTTYHAKPLIFVGANDDKVVAIDNAFFQFFPPPSDFTPIYTFSFRVDCLHTKVAMVLDLRSP